MPPEIQRLTNQFLHNPERVEVSPPSSTVSTIVQRIVPAPSDPKQKREALRKLLRSQTNVKNAIVFANRKTTVGVLEASLKRHGFNAAALHGDMDQRARLRTLDAFRANEITYLIASDVAARGLDIPDVSHVFNYDVPIHAEDYVHRIGRTGRAGREGHAFMLATHAEAKYVKAIEQLTKQTITVEGDVAPLVAESEAEASHKRSRGSAKRHPRAERSPRSEAVSRTENSPRAEAAPRRQERPREDRRPPRSLPDAPDSKGFHTGNMPAFLSRPVKTA
jgi:superfamily II DNA/RNA helicase